MLCAATAARSKDSHPVRIVEIDPGVVPARERHQGVERVQVAAHRVDPLDHDQAAAMLAALPFERALQGGDVGVREHVQVGA